MKKALRETQTLRAKKSRPATDPLPGGAGPPKFNQLERDGHYVYLQTQFGEDRCTQFRVIVVTDTARPPVRHKQRPPHTHRQDRLQYTAPLSLARSVTTPHTHVSGTRLAY